MKINFFYLFFTLVGLLSFSCNNNSKSNVKDVKKPKKEIKKKIDKKNPDSSFEIAKSNLKNFEKGKVSSSKILDNGIVIKWIIKSGGRKIKTGEMVLLEYRLALPDGKIIDGNNKLNLPFIPFIAGYNLQTLGWDLAVKELSVGDFAKIEIPSELAYGKKGLKNIIPPNSKNWLYVKVHAFVAPGIKRDGISSWKLKEGSEITSNISNRELSFHAIVSSQSKPSIMNTYLSNAPIKYVIGQENIVPGLRKILRDANKGDKYYVILDSKNAYGSKGYTSLIKPNESIFFNIEVFDVKLL